MNLVSEMLLTVIKKNDEDLEKDENLDSSFGEFKNSLRMKILICNTWLRMLKTMREEKELILQLKGFCPGNKIPRGILIQGTDALKSAFERYKNIKSADSVNEKRPN